MKIAVKGSSGLPAQWVPSGRAFPYRWNRKVRSSRNRTSALVSFWAS